MLEPLTCSILNGMTGRYASYPHLDTVVDDVELRGAITALDTLANLMETASEQCVVMLSPIANADVAPYDYALGTISITPDETTLIRATRMQDRLDIAGSQAARSILARNLLKFSEWFAEGTLKNTSHQHIEYYPDHPYIAEDSLPFVVTVDLSSAT